MGKPAARVGDEHECQMVTPGTGSPHIGGPIKGPGCQSVLIEGQPAAIAGDICTCVGAVDTITDGSTGVFIGGKPAARSSDPCAHGGMVIGGCGTVLIGESMGRNFLWLPCVWENDGEHDEPSTDDKIVIVKKVISNCIDLLEKRLELLLHDDPETVGRFEKWFGYFDEERKLVIAKRMEKQIAFFKTLGMDRFSRIAYEIQYRIVFAQVYSWDNNTIYLGHPFWNNKLRETLTREAVFIHEISHFKGIGRTVDYKYDDDCEELAKARPDKALKNADSYAFFITGYK